VRAREFVAESDGNAIISKRNQSGTRGLNTFSDGERWNTDYTLNRVMMAAACTDGTFVPEIDKKSWFGKGKTAHPYTQQEQDMMKMAYKAAGAEWSDLNSGDLDSEEVTSTNKQSPIKGFGGYPR
jgi:hypothetical protein